MVRIFARPLLILGIFILSLTALLSYARCDEPTLEWILYTTARQNSPIGSELYAVLSDGTHSRSLTTLRTNYEFYYRWSKAGWVTVQISARGQDSIWLVHLNGRTQHLLTYTGTAAWVTAESANGQTLYLNVINRPSPPYQIGEIWQVNRRTGKSQKVDLPSLQTDNRYRLDEATFIIWSNHESGGDLYQLNIENPTQLKRLTTRGDVSRTIPFAQQSDWVYFYTNGETTSLYRIQPDGSQEQFVKEVIVYNEAYRGFWSSNVAKIYFWTGGPDGPTFIEANPDGSDPRLIEGIPENITVHSWSPDHAWVYFTYGLLPEAAIAPFVPILTRFNLHTGEQQEVTDNFTRRSLAWTADGEWIFWVGGEGRYGTLYRARPDGSQREAILERLLHDFYPLEQTDSVAFTTYHNQRGYEIYTLDLRTEEIADVPTPQPAYRSRQIIGSIPSPAYEWENGRQLVLVGVISVGIGLIALVRRQKGIKI